MKKTGNELRQNFLEYFARQGHQIISSSSLLPKNDSSLLFTNAGMVQFKQIFLGQEKRDYMRATTNQKCFRASGKHNDLENVGRTTRHHTFFEMLGNFSFGDYFKQKAISYAWELLVHIYGLDPSQLWISVHKKDEITANYWETETGIKRSRIVWLGDKDNFWSMGDTGPCGPCSEIYIDQGSNVGCGHSNCAIGCNCDRYLELWNLVFMQYNRDTNGSITTLPKPSIDTGMGLERITAVIQNKKSNYDSDLFAPLLAQASELAGINYNTSIDSDVSLRIIVDHARAFSFLITDGIMPSNEGRGYVLRRILRRACRYGRKIGLNKPFLYQLIQTVANQMRVAYPKIYDSVAFVEKIVFNEEKRFSETLSTGLRLLNEALAEAKIKGESLLSGEIAFKIYDTYGFPLDFTKTIVKEEGFSLDESGFQLAMNAQRTRSRATWKGFNEEEVPLPILNLLKKGFRTLFQGYKETTSESQAELILIDNQEANVLVSGQKAELITSKTPFYGEAGGQIGDTGQINGPNGQANVYTTTKISNEITIHHIQLIKGIINKGDVLNLQVDTILRKAISANHTSTHLLHAALRRHLGEQIHQAGSLITSDRLRLDFYYPQAVTQEQIRVIEHEINAIIRQNLPVYTSIMILEEALKTSATALFEERYGNDVRIVEIEGTSKEFCGGTHLKQTGEIGLFKIINESSIANGIRRLEAITGKTAIESMLVWENELNRAAIMIKSNRSELADKIQKLQTILREREREIEILKTRLIANTSQELLKNITIVKGIKILAASVPADNPRSLRELSDTIYQKICSGIIVLGAENKGKVFLLAIVTKDLTNYFQANNIIKELIPLIVGHGGGRPELAEAGGQNPAGLKKALAKVLEIVTTQMAKKFKN